MKKYKVKTYTKEDVLLEEKELTKEEMKEYEIDIEDNEIAGYYYGNKMNVEWEEIKEVD